MFRRALLPCFSLLSLAGPALGEPLSKKIEIDFFRDVPSRNLKSLATRSDGRLVAGPTLKDLDATAPADLLWCLEPTNDPAKWLIGTGPDGRIFEVTLDAAQSGYTAREIAKLDDPQVYAVKRLADGTILAGTSPKGAVYLIRDEAVVARVALPVDSIFDLLLIDQDTALAATGNPGRIYRIDLRKLAVAGLNPEKTTDKALLAERGFTLFGEIRDRNVRRIVALSDGRIAAGSAPKGNLYTFAAEGSAPVILQENRDAEVTDLLPQPNGDLFATLVFSSTTNESRITPPVSAVKNPRDPKEEIPPPPPAQAERFGGRSSLVWFPANGFAETLTARGNTAFYRIVRRGDVLLVAGGEQGELAGYDLKARLSLTFAGSISSQLNGLAALPGGEKFLLLRNNAPGLAVLDFTPRELREAETRRLDLSTPSRIGALRFNRLRHVTEADITAEVRTSNGSDEVEGWGPWAALTVGADSGWRGENLRGRHVKLRLRIADSLATSTLEVDRATLFGLPQNRRPLLQEFRVLTSGYGLIPASEPNPPLVTSLSQLMQPPKEDDRRRGFLNSQVMPTPGAQVVVWNLVDPDGDALLATFSIRRDGDPAWIDLVTGSREAYAQFDTRHLPDGIYFTRLVASETAPRPEADRLNHTFETDDLVVDHAPPEVIEASARRTGESVIVTVRGQDRLSLLEGIEVLFSNGVREVVEQPADGVRDGREETFVLEVPLARISNATSLEVTLHDLAGNTTARRLNW